MIQDDFDAYKKAVRQHYEKEKEGIYSSFLWQPSRANLRKLCVERFKENPCTDDLNTFRMFMGFEFSTEHKNRLKEETDRFRNIENFLKGITDTSDPELVNLTAILVDFKPRPFLKFSRSLNVEKDIPLKIESGDVGLSTTNPIAITIKKRSLKKNLIFGFLGFAALFSVGYPAKDLILTKKECMQWQEDHYVEIDCQEEINSFYASSPIIPYDERTSTLKKVTVSDTTTFFRDSKALIWYCKVNGTPEYFNEPGLHPITGKALRPITYYIINKYVKK